MRERKIVRGKMAFTLFALCWLIYFASYIARINYSAVMAELIGENVLSKAQAGWISTAFFFSYAVGQLISGVLADKVRPEKLITIGLLASGLSSIAFGSVRSFPAMCALRLVTGLSFAALWPPMVRLFADKFSRADAVRYSVHMTTSTVAGTLCAYFLAALMLRIYGWPQAFFVPGTILFFAAAMWEVGYRMVRRGETVICEEEESAATRREKVSVMRILMLPGMLALLVPVTLHGAIKDGVTAWIPTYVSEIFSLKPDLTALLSTILPVINLTGAYAAKYVYQRMKGREELSSAVFFGIAAAAFAGLLLVNGKSLAAMLVLLSIVTSSMLAVNTLLIAILPLKFEGRTASISGMFNAIAYFGSALASGFIGVMSEKWGWDSTVFSWFAAMLIALTACLFSARSKLR